jgi:hypothetical protein
MRNRSKEDRDSRKGSVKRAQSRKSHAGLEEKLSRFMR